jgi:hypothetical protein
MLRIGDGCSIEMTAPGIRPCVYSGKRSGAIGTRFSQRSNASCAPFSVRRPVLYKNPAVQISWGELIDKITILEIKSERLTAQQALQNVRHELAALSRPLEGIEIPPNLSYLRSKLRDINERLWQIEDSIRDKEARKEFDQEFIDLARSVYITNDERGRIKREINALLKSRLIEEKQYTPY